MGQPRGRKDLRKGVTWLVGSGVLALLCLSGGGMMLLLSRAPQPIPVAAITAESGTVEVTLNESGTVLLGGQQTLQSPVEGAVDRVLVQPGDRVQQGQTLVVLRNPERQTALSNQELLIRRQEVNLLRSRQRVAENQEQLTSDQRQLERLRALGQEGAIAQTEIQDQENRVRTGLTNLRTSQADAQLAALELERLQLERQRIQQQLKDTLVVAPITGVVLGVAVQDGDGVDRRTQLLTVGNPGEERVELQLSTLNAGQVRQNQRARVTVLGPDPAIFWGRVVQIYPQAIATTEGNTPSTVPIAIRLDTPSRTLIPGSQVNVEIILAQRQNVLTLPLESIQNADRNPFVWTLDPSNRAQRQPVDLGLEGLTTVEVTDGLAVGDRVLLPNPNTPIQPGSLVQVEQEP